MKKVLRVLLVSLLVLGVLPVGIGEWKIPAMAVGSVIVQIAAGGYHSLALFSDGSLYAWGSNLFNQLGNGSYGYNNTPVLIGTGYTAIAAGGYHSLALKGDTLYTWGHNSAGQLGDGSTPGWDVNKNTPVKIGTGFTAIAAGGSHSLALKGDTLYAWGDNSNGQLGDGTYTDRNIPLQIGIGFTAISAGLRHTLALKGDTLFAWGRNNEGQLGTGPSGSNNSRNMSMRRGTGFSAIAASYNYSATIQRNALLALGSNGDDQLHIKTLPPLPICKNTPAQIGTGFTTIAAGDIFSLALKGNTLYEWGNSTNMPTQIGTGFTAIAAGIGHSLALKENTLFTWGGNHYGQLGDRTNTTRFTLEQIGIGYTVIEAGFYYSLALKGNIIYAWGDNRSGQLGNRTTTDKNTPTEVKIPSFSTPTSTSTSTSTSAPTPTHTPIPTQTPTTNVINIATAQTKVYLKKASSATLGIVPVTGDNYVAKLKWKSSDPNTVSVTQTGKVKALKTGSAIITAAADNGKSVKIDVIVGGKAAKSISIKNPPKGNTMTIGDALKLKITTEPANAQGVIIFHSTNEKIVSVDAAGRLRALKKGSATIVVMMGTKAVTLYLKVK